MHHIIRWKYTVGAVALIVLACSFILPFGVQGASSTAQGFRTEHGGDIVAGTLVSVQRDNPNLVEPSSLENADLLFGVVTEAAAIEVYDEDSTIQVARSGITLALVSDINGNIQTGDPITASPIEGVGMLAAGSIIVVGVAQSGLDAVETTNHQVVDRDGSEKTVRVGLVPVQLDRMFYSRQEGASSFIPSFVQDVANSVAGKQVSPTRVIVAALLLILLFVSVLVLLYSATKSSIISIGRNPLSEKAVHRSLFEVGLTVVGILAFAVILIYLILTI